MAHRRQRKKCANAAQKKQNKNLLSGFFMAERELDLFHLVAWEARHLESQYLYRAGLHSSNKPSPPPPPHSF
jgi:hypothetical protein